MHSRRAAADKHEPADAARRAAAGAATPAAQPRICLCVDDFGLHGGINEAALQLAGLRRVHALSAMVGAPAWRDGATALRRLATAGIDIGLHLDLTEHPLRPGSRRGLRELVVASLLRRLDPLALRAEIGAQLDAFEQARGAAPAFVDGHQHVHQLPVVRQALLAELARRYGAPRPWLRSTRRPRPDGRALPGKETVIELLGARGLAALARQHGHAQNRHLLGVHDFSGGAARYRERLAVWLAMARDGDLLMCHPSQLPDGTDPIGAARQAEFEVLASTDFAALLQRAGLTLAPMSAILAETRG